MASKPESFNGVPVPYGVSIAELSQMIESSGPEKWAAFVALAHHDGEGALNVLTGAALSPDPHTRRAAIEAIGRHLRGQEFSHLVYQGLQDSSELVIRTACEAASNLKLPAAHDAVFELLNDRSPSTRWSAVRALDVLWQESDFAKMLQLAQNDRVGRVRKEAAWTLQSHASKANWQPLFEAWRGEHPPRHRVWACEIAAKFGGPDTLPALAELGSDPDGHVRRAAVNAIGRIQQKP